MNFDLINSRLAARADISQVEVLADLDHGGARADAIALRHWRRLWRSLGAGKSYQHNYQVAAGILTQLARELRLHVVGQLEKAALIGYRQAAHALLANMPVSLLSLLPRRFQEDVSISAPEPAVTKTRGRQIIKQHLFPAPTKERIERMLAPFVRPHDWRGIGDGEKRMPEDLAAQIALSFSQGKTPAQVSRDVRPYLDGSRVRARRVARTFGTHIATEQQLELHAGLGELLVGYQIHATRDQFTRPWHAARDGTVYYLKPEHDQKGLSAMPRPPLEAPDASLRPPDTPAIAFN